MERTGMGIGDFVSKVKDLASGNKDKVKEGIDKAGDLLDEKTDGKFSDQIEQGEESAKSYVEGLDDEA